MVGIAEAMLNLTERGAIDPVVKVTVALTDSGMASIQDAIVYGEIKDDSIAGKLKGLFGGGSSSSSSSETDTDTATATSTTGSDEATPTPAKPVPNTIPISLNIRHLSLTPYTKEAKDLARKRLVAMDAAEKARHKKEEARNNLEGYLYRLRDLLDGGETSPFILFSKPDERKRLEEKLGQAFTWLGEHAEDGELGEFWAHRDALE